MKLFVAFLCASVFSIAVPAGAAPALRLAGRTEMPGYSGDFDHFAYDLQTRRLWLAAEDHGTLDVFDLSTGTLRESLHGVVDTPHAVFYLRRKDRLIITDSGGQAKVLEHRTRRTLQLAAPASDAMAFDASTGRLFIVNGGRDAKMRKPPLSGFEPVRLKRLGDVKFDTDKGEAMAVEQKGNRLYVNVTGRNEMAVVD